MKMYLESFRNFLTEISKKEMKKQVLNKLTKSNYQQSLEYFDRAIDKIEQELGNKFLQWGIKKLFEIMEKYQYEFTDDYTDYTIQSVVDYLIDVGKRFIELGTSGALNSAVSTGHIEPVQIDISFWMKKSIVEFEEFVGELSKYVSKTKRIKIAKKEGSDFIFEDDDVFIVRPRTKETSCFYGRDSQWCIAATKSTNYFDQYTRQGKMFIFIINKGQAEEEEYQLIALVYNCHEKYLEEIYDANDRRLKGTELPFEYKQYADVIEEYIFDAECDNVLFEQISSVMNNLTIFSGNATLEDYAYYSLSINIPKNIFLENTNVEYEFGYSDRRKMNTRDLYVESIEDYGDSFHVIFELESDEESLLSTMEDLAGHEEQNYYQLLLKIRKNLEKDEDYQSNKSDSFRLADFMESNDPELIYFDWNETNNPSETRFYTKPVDFGYIPDHMGAFITPAEIGELLEKNLTSAYRQEADNTQKELFESYFLVQPFYNLKIALKDKDNNIDVDLGRKDLGRKYKGIDFVATTISMSFEIEEDVARPENTTEKINYLLWLDQNYETVLDIIKSTIGEVVKKVMLL